MSDWFPDFIARWYDAFVPVVRNDEVAGWRRVYHPTAQSVSEKLRRTPNDAAAEIDDWIKRGSFSTQEERRYRALQGVNDAMRRAWAAAAYDADSDQWLEIRMQWRMTGSMLKAEKGLLLPRRSLRHRWAVAHPWIANGPRDHFEEFLRWRGTEVEGLTVESRVLSNLTGPATLRTRLTVGAVPLIESVADFEWTPLDRENGDARFRVMVRDAAAAANAAAAALIRAGEERCDVVVFPELSFDPVKQEEFGAVVRQVAHAHQGYPWLVVAGTALAPTGDASTLHNRAIVFDADGREVFRYNKLHPYRMSESELGRYGLPHVFNGVARTEDISALPLWAGVADTPIGRIAVVICEDLANIDFYLPFVKALAVDWLLVPVLDGAQIDGRWTARKAAVYAEYGTSIVVVTSRSLVEAHRRFETSQGRTVPAPGVALIARLGGELHLLESTGTHDHPVFKSLTSTRV